MSNRRLAGEDSKRCRSGRNNTPSAPPASAASFKRRSQRSSVPFNQSNTAAQTPELKACSAAHNASVAVVGRTTNRRVSSIPCCARAGAYGSCGGAIQTSQGISPLVRCDSTRAGRKSCTSPKPVSSNNTSMSDAVGHPPPGKRASSELQPVDQTGRVGAAEASFNLQTRARAKIQSSDDTSRGIHVFTATKHPDDDPFDNHGLLLEVDTNGFEIGIFGQQPYDGAFLSIALHGDFVFQARDHDLAITPLGRAIYGH